MKTENQIRATLLTVCCSCGKTRNIKVTTLRDYEKMLKKARWLNIYHGNKTLRQCAKCADGVLQQ